MADVKDILRQFQDVTNGFIKQNEDTGAIRFLRTTVKTLEVITKKIDAFLKSKNIDVGARLSQLSDKGTAFKDKAKDLFANTKTDVKSMGIKGFLNAKAAGVKATLSNAFVSDTEGSTAPPNTASNLPSLKAAPDGLLTKLQTTLQGLTSSIADLAKKSASSTGTDNQPQVSSSKSSGSADYQDALNKAKERAELRTKEIADEKAAVAAKAAGSKIPKGGGWLGKVIGSIAKLGGFVVGGFGKIILKAIPALVGMTGKVMGMVLGKIAPKLAGMIARGTSSLVAGGAKAAAKGAWGVAKAAVPALWAGAKAVGGAVLGAVGTTGLIIAGGVVAAGLLIYGGYKLYKYLNRNNVATDVFGQLTRLRLLMYGFNDAKKESYYRLLELEMMMKDYVQFKDDRVSFVKLDKDFKEKIRELFEVKPDEKEKFALLNRWFAKRFMPSLKAFLDAFMPLGPNLYLDKLDKLSKDQVFMLATKLSVPTSIFDVSQVPTFDAPDTSVSKQEVDDLLTSIRTNAKANSKALEGPGAKKISETNQKQTQGPVAAVSPKPLPAPKTSTTSSATTPAQMGTSIEDIKQASKERLNNPLSFAPGAATQPFAKLETPQQEGEAPVKNTPGKPLVPLPSAVPSEATKLNIAPGSLQPADKSLQGVTVGPKGVKEKLFNLHPKVFSLFTGMTKEFNTLTGKNVTVNESFRSYDDQMALRQKYPNKAAKPGNSIHEFGMALDVNTPEANLLDEMGLLRKYGFTRPVGGETWHLEPAGVAINPQAAKADPQKREQALDSSPGRGGGGFGAAKSTPLGKRNMPLQQKLYNEGSASTVDLAALTEKTQDTQQFKAPITPPPSAEKAKANTSTTPAATPTTSPTPTAPPTSSTTSSSVAQSSTKNSLSASGASTPTPNSLEPAGKSAMANLDPGAIGSKDLNPAQAIRKAANVVGMNPEAMVTFAKLESSLDPKAGAATSSAKGLFQITKPTWGGLLSSQGTKYNVPRDADIFDPYYNALMGISYAKENAKAVLPLGGQAGLADEASLYLAHHFGPSGSKRLLDVYMKNPNTPTQDAVSGSTFSANQAALGGKTVGEYIQSLRTKMSTAAGTPETAYKGMKGASSSPSTPAATQRVLGTSNVVTEAYPSNSNPSYSASSTTLPAKSPSSTSIPPAGASSRMGRPEMPTSSVATSTPIPQSAVIATPLPPQSSQTQNLNPSNEILSNQLNVLIDIKKILEGFSGMGSRSSSGPTPQQPPAALAATPPPTGAPSTSTPAPIVAPLKRAPSTTSVSMSRRTLA